MVLKEGSTSPTLSSLKLEYRLKYLNIRSNRTRGFNLRDLDLYILRTLNYEPILEANVVATWTIVGLNSDIAHESKLAWRAKIHILSQGGSNIN